jgi:hypothetical protein
MTRLDDMARRKITITKPQWREAIEKGFGQNHLVADELKIHRHTVERYKDKHEWLRGMFDEYLQTAVPNAVATILKNIDNPKIAMWFLDRQARHLGYGAHTKVEKENDEKPRVVLHYIDDGRNPYGPGEEPTDEPKPTDKPTTEDSLGRND